MSKRKRVFIHYGADKFDPEHQYKPYWCNRKPVGLWASAEKAQYGWKEWVEREQFHPESLEKEFKFTLSKQAKILQIHKEKEIIPFLKNYNPNRERLFFNICGSVTDFEDELDIDKLYAKYDGIEVFMSEDYIHFHNGLFNLWDVDSICIWNLDKVRPLES